MELSWWEYPFASAPWPVQIAVMTGITVLVACVIYFLIILQGKSVGHSFSDHYWPIIKQNPWCVLAYRACIYGLALGAAWIGFSRFG